MLSKGKERLTAWAKFVVGLLILSGMVIFFSSGYTPPGVCGDVIRHNQEYNIDASPFFFGDVENMSEYEEGVRILMQKAKRENVGDLYQ